MSDATKPGGAASRRGQVDSSPVVVESGPLYAYFSKTALGDKLHGDLDVSPLGYTAKLFEPGSGDYVRAVVVKTHKGELSGPIIGSIKADQVPRFSRLAQKEILVGGKVVTPSPQSASDEPAASKRRKPLGDALKQFQEARAQTGKDLDELTGHLADIGNSLTKKSSSG